jgi:hypothetical protein
MYLYLRIIRAGIHITVPCEVQICKLKQTMPYRNNGYICHPSAFHFQNTLTYFEFDIGSPRKNKFIECEFGLYQPVRLYASFKELGELE